MKGGSSESSFDIIKGLNKLFEDDFLCLKMIFVKCISFERFKVDRRVNHQTRLEFSEEYESHILIYIAITNSYEFFCFHFVIFNKYINIS